ncbi:tripartite motif-containing protein 16-like [Nematolebias whitei]|uniref:tripartite motif-containing protein 16-like n=1 Tax=Nematolebias whitei TaxID=451745 RepID=UPI0018983319|nr:tripartite motif-containing protein 16-like [Nematolebias whitei]
MAQKRSLDQEHLNCSICLDLLKDPVTPKCGHSFCTSCIENHWDREDHRRYYTCPQCRKRFRRRPAVAKTIVLADLVEELKKNQQAAPADHCYAGPEDVSCDVCSERKLKAAKFCLVCLASFCEKHLQPHHEAPPLQKHQLVEPSKKLQENICPRHNEMIKVFCRTDQKLICSRCLVDEHQGHETVSAAAGRAEKQKELEASRQQIQQRIQDQEKDVKLLQEEVEAINVSANKTVEDSEKIFTQLIRLVQKRRSEVKQQIRSQQETEVSRVLELQEKLEQEITELKRKDAELEQLSHTEDHNQFLHNYQSVSALGESPHSSSIQVHPRRYFENITAAVEELRDKLCGGPNNGQAVLSLTGPDVLLSHPKSRAEFLRSSQDVTLDPDTAHRRLVLSEGRRKATLVEEQQSYPDRPGRFLSLEQVLSSESLSGRCYWEVEWSGRGVCIGVSYNDSSRNFTTLDCRFGFSDKSWALYCGTNGYAFSYNKNHTPVPGPGSSRVGVYLDHRAGVLSFYSVSVTMTLLHSVQTKFTQPLHAGVWLVGCGSTAEFIETKRNSRRVVFCKPEASRVPEQHEG